MDTVVNVIKIDSNTTKIISDLELPPPPPVRKAKTSTERSRDFRARKQMMKQRQKILAEYSLPTKNSGENSGDNYKEIQEPYGTKILDMAVFSDQDRYYCEKKKKTSVLRTRRWRERRKLLTENGKTAGSSDVIGDGDQEQLEEPEQLQKEQLLEEYMEPRILPPRKRVTAKKDESFEDTDEDVAEIVLGNESYAMDYDLTQSAATSVTLSDNDEIATEHYNKQDLISSTLANFHDHNYPTTSRLSTNEEDSCDINLAKIRRADNFETTNLNYEKSYTTNLQTPFSINENIRNGEIYNTSRGNIRKPSSINKNLSHDGNVQNPLCVKKNLNYDENNTVNLQNQPIRTKNLNLLQKYTINNQNFGRSLITHKKRNVQNTSSITEHLNDTTNVQMSNFSRDGNVRKPSSITEHLNDTTKVQMTNELNSENVHANILSMLLEKTAEHDAILKRLDNECSIDGFFRSISNSVKRLKRPDLIQEAKMKTLELIFDLEKRDVKNDMNDSRNETDVGHFNTVELNEQNLFEGSKIEIKLEPIG